jgi:hypothetical protein
MNFAIPTLLRAAAAAILLASVLAGTTVAVERPPVRPEQQRAWLTDRIVADMQAMGMFSGGEIAETVNLVDSLTDEQVVLLVRLYVLMREIVEQDAQLLAVDSSETLVGLRRTIRRAYWELVAISPGCRTLCEVAYATVTGWCARWRHAVPDWYYQGGCYVGPCRSARYGGAYSVRAYKTHFDSGSRHYCRDGGNYFHGNIVKKPKGTHGGHHRYAAANKHPHPKTRHGTARTSKHGPPPRAKHGGPTGVAKHRGPHKGRNVAAHPTKHGPPKAGHGRPAAAAKHGKHPKTGRVHAPSTKARHGGPHSKPAPHSHSKPHRQQPKRGATHAKPAAHHQSHPQHAAHGQGRHKAGRARHK